MEKYKNKYRIESTRATWWNYGWTGAYFITIRTKNREHYFGENINKKMQLSQCGVLADVLWHEIPHHQPRVSLGEFVVMPNHIHGILILDAPSENNIGNESGKNIGNDLIHVQTGHALSIPDTEKSESEKRFRNPGKNTISSIIGGYKSAVTKHANRLGLENGWQTRFHDHIIRNDGEYQRISDYIMNNPLNWKEDKFFNHD